MGAPPAFPMCGTSYTCTGSRCCRKATWRPINATGDWHPEHVHLVQFRVLDRQPFSLNAFNTTGRVVLTGQPVSAGGGEAGCRKDTVKCPPGMVTRITAKFDLSAGTQLVPGHRFRYIWRCHILEHEDNEMMRPYDVIA